MITGAVNYEHMSEHKDNEGRFVMITGKIEGTVMSFLTFMCLLVVIGPFINVYLI